MTAHQARRDVSVLKEVIIIIETSECYRAMKEPDVVFISGLTIPDVDKLRRLVGFTTYYEQGVWYMHKFNEHKTNIKRT